MYNFSSTGAILALVSILSYLDEFASGNNSLNTATMDMA